MKSKNLDAKDRQLLNWTLEQITKTKRLVDQAITDEELAILLSGKFGANTTFGLPPNVTRILDQL